jgi:CP family cyanate transporter-like MFS transporter
MRRSVRPSVGRREPPGPGADPFACATIFNCNRRNHLQQSGPGAERATRWQVLTLRQALTLGCAWLAAVNTRAPLLAIGPLLPLVMSDLKMSFTLAGLVSGIPLLLMGAFGLPGGWLVDRLGARQIMIGALLGVTAGGVVRGLAPNEPALLGGTVLLGLAIGLVQPALPRVARDTLPLRTSFASAIYFNGLVVGGAAGLALTPWLVGLAGPAGWRGVLVGWAALGAVATVGWLALGESQHTVRHRGRLRFADIAAALQLPGMAALTLAMGTQSAIFYTFGSWTPAFLTSRGWPLGLATLPVATMPAMSILASTIAAPAEARFGRRAMIALSGIVVSVGLAAFVVWPDQSVWLAAITSGLGTTWAFSVCMAAPAALAPANRVGLTAGVLLALGYGEATLGPLALGALRDAFGSYAVGWWLTLGLGLVLTATALGIPRRKSLTASGC